MIIPQGLIHYSQNLDCEPVKFLGALNNEDPGVYTVSTRTFTLPIEALTVTFNQNPVEIQQIKDALPNSVAKGREECLKRCRRN